jgi:hypothetical protein
MFSAGKKVATVADARGHSPDEGLESLPPPHYPVPLFSTCCIKPLDRCANAGGHKLIRERAAHRLAAQPE